MKTFLSENSVFLKTVAVGLAVLVLFLSLPVSASADEEVSSTPVLVPYIESETVPADALLAGANVYGSSYYLWTTAGGPLYAFLFHDPNGYNYVCVATPTAGTIYNSNRPVPDLDGSTTLYYSNGDALRSSFLPLYSSQAEGLAAVRALVDNPPTPPESVSTLNYSLPPGNVAFVKLPDDVSLFEGVTLRTQMPETNFLYAPNGQLWNTSQRIGFSDSLPTADYDLSQFSIVPWAKDGETTVLGVTDNAIYNRGPLLIGNEYMVIVNPIYYGGTANGPYEFLINGAVQINAVGVKGISVYALDSSIGFTSQGGLTVPTEVIGDPFGGEIDSETGEITWTDPSGGTNSPTEGGNNLIPTGETVFDAVKKIASDFADFLKGPISAIRTVVSAITNFLTEFKSLYVWLPGPVYNLITSAIMVALTIGVVKIFV